MIEAQDGLNRPVLPLPDSQGESDTSIASESVPEIVSLPDGDTVFYRRELHGTQGNGGDRQWIPSTGVRIGEISQDFQSSVSSRERPLFSQMRQRYAQAGMEIPDGTVESRLRNLLGK